LLLTSRVKTGKDGRMALRVRCTASGAERCTVSLTLRSRLPARVRTSRIAGATFDLARGVGTVVVRLTLPARSALRTRSSLAARAALRTTRASATAKTRSRRVTILRHA